VAVPTAANPGFDPPTLADFFPGHIWGGDSFWVPTRLNAIAILMAGVVSLIFLIAFRKPQVVPRGMQNLGEIAVDFVQVQIIDEIMGKEGRRFLPLMCTIFFMILALNLTGVIPLLNITATSAIGFPLVLAAIAWVMFNYVGIKKQGGWHYLKGVLFPPGVPFLIYFLLTPIELISTFILRPVTLTIRLMANMMAGHFMLALFFGGANYLLFHADVQIRVFGVASVLMGFIFTIFELVVAFLQAYIFTLLTAVYIAGAQEAH
jgi:F-type H+-transporting ATPase subunit a